MYARRLVLLGLLSVLGVAVVDSDAQAGIFRKKKNTCNTCAVQATCNTCGVATAACNTCVGGVAYAPTGGVRVAMPMPAGTTTGTIVPATGTAAAGGTVVAPAGAIVTS